MKTRLVDHSIAKHIWKTRWKGVQLLWQEPHPSAKAELPSCSAAAAAKSLQSRPMLCNPIDGSLPGSPVPGILQARVLELLCTKLQIHESPAKRTTAELSAGCLPNHRIKKCRSHLCIKSWNWGEFPLQLWLKYNNSLLHRSQKRNNIAKVDKVLKRNFSKTATQKD